MPHMLYITFSTLIRKSNPETNLKDLKPRRQAMIKEGKLIMDKFDPSSLKKIHSRSQIHLKSMHYYVLILKVLSDTVVSELILS